MKDTPYTNECIQEINRVINDLAEYTDFEYEPFICMYPEDFASELDIQLNELNKVDIERIKMEFEHTMEDYSKLFFQKKLFEFKFEKLLSWKYDYENGFDENNSQYRHDFYVFTDYQLRFQVDIDSLGYSRLRTIFELISSRVTLLKKYIQTMLKQYEDLGQVYLEANNLTILPNNKQEEEEKTKAVAESLLNIRLAYGKKTDFIKIVSAMYDCKIFVGLDGKSLTNKQKLMDAFGEFLDEDFTKYSTFLSQAKDRGIDVFMKPLKDLELAFKAYLNFTVKK